MEIAKVLKADGDFAHPDHSWERGLNENTNGLIRQYLPKGTDFNKLTDRQVLEIMDKLNNRPRKCLGYKDTQSGILRDQPTHCTCELDLRFITFRGLTPTTSVKLRAFEREAYRILRMMAGERIWL